MSNPAKQKGDRFERSVVHLLGAEGISASRTLLPAQAGRQNPGDLIIQQKYRAECKARKSAGGFKLIDSWMGENDFLICKRDYKSPLVCMRWDTFIDLLKRSMTVE